MRWHAATFKPVLRLSRLPFFRALSALAIAIASPGVEVGHGLAHEHEHEQEHQLGALHHDDGIVSTADPATDHPHERISEALRNRSDAAAFIPLPAARVVADPPAVLLSPPISVSDDRPSGDRATGPPPSLRAPPID